MVRLNAERLGGLCAQFTSPVEVNWGYMDEKLLQRFWSSRSNERAGLASIADRTLVFHRGITTVRAHACTCLTHACTLLLGLLCRAAEIQCP